ncbi:uncharacterized protein PV06_11525 [Exophiala oligosperma]|uniref:Uncharacterized protein n=1 Tax=Exophiala oligosperma TaxID=215243 RepID=A0A0D2BFB0_9EURO|nr:uncharacterized protein PV06_11525 [Exophiala oligosperma]KIW36197.1 hypothetical protein PV06_11525 [Exophiala oligosperma]
MQKREADGAERQMVEVPTVAATEVASAQLGETFGEHIWNQPEQRRQRANAINDVQPTFGHDPGALETGDDCFTIISQRISGLPEAQLIKAANCVRNISRSLHGLPCQEWERIGGPVSRARHVEAINVMQTA